MSRIAERLRFFLTGRAISAVERACRELEQARACEAVARAALRTARAQLDQLRPLRIGAGSRSSGNERGERQYLQAVDEWRDRRAAFLEAQSALREAERSFESARAASEERLAAHSPRIHDVAAAGTPVERFWAEHTVATAMFLTPTASHRQLEHRFREYPLFREFSGLWGSHDGETVLDFGCGPGNDLIGLLLYGNAAHAVGIDVSPRALRLASRRVALHRISPRRVSLYRIADAAPKLPLPSASIDAVNCQGVLMHVSDPGAILREFARVMRPEAEARIMVYNRESIWFHLYAAYVKQILAGDYASLPTEQAFGYLTDGPDCPVSRCWSQVEFIERCGEAGLQASYLGGYLSRHELEVLSEYGERARQDSRLAPVHRDFLARLESDPQGLPRIDGRHAGIGGSYRVRVR